MPVRVIATDMDGTFLRDNLHYDEARFNRLYQRFTAAGGRFVAASGKQYLNLRGFFPHQQDEMVFIAENGALVKQGEKRLYACPLPKGTVSEIARLVNSYGINMLMCGEGCAYVLEGDAEYRHAMSKYYHNLTEISPAGLGGLDEEDIFKFSLLMPPEDIPANFARLRADLDSRFALMSSGFGYLDILNAEANKGVALEYLCSLWDIPFEERMAFGDAGNDADMLRRVKYSYAMQNAAPDILALAAYTAPPCSEDGVLQVMEQLLDGKLDVD